jgi:hypothetical protein
MDEEEPVGDDEDTECDTAEEEDENELNTTDSNSENEVVKVIAATYAMLLAALSATPCRAYDESEYTVVAVPPG